jgi:DNA-binding transcriptional ArsR family regulator
MLTELFTSRTRISLLLKLFLNPEVSSYLRELAREFNLTPNALKEELDNLSGTGYLEKEQRGNSIFYKANTKHPIFPEIHSIVKKYFGIDKILDQILNDLGKVDAVYALDDYAIGRDSGLIDVLIVGDVDMDKIQGLRRNVEMEIKRKIRLMVMSAQEFAESSEMILKRPNWRML